MSVDDFGTRGRKSATPAVPRQWPEFPGYLVSANEPGHSFTYCYDLDHDRTYTVVIEEITAVDPDFNDVMIIDGAS